MACAPRNANRGYVFEETRIEKLQTGDARADVIAALGVPSARSPIDNKTVYYIYSHFQTNAAYTPVETSRRILAIQFDAKNKVAALTHLNLEDGVVVAIASDITKTQGNAISVAQQIFGNFGRFGAAGAPTDF